MCSLVLLPGAAKAQPAGGPLLTGTHAELTVSLDAGYFKKTIGGVENRSRRMFLRATYGLAGRLDLFGILGLAKLQLELVDSTGAELEDKFRPAYGAGFSLRMLRLHGIGMSVFMTGHVIRFKSTPSNTRTFQVEGADVSQVLEVDYDWREANINLGLAQDLKFMTVYGGVNLKYIERDEEKVEKLVFGGEGVAVASQSGTYKSGVLAMPLLGAEIKLPARLRLNFEAAAGSDSDFTFYIGVSQTGSP